MKNRPKWFILILLFLYFLMVSLVASSLGLTSSGTLLMELPTQAEGLLGTAEFLWQILTFPLTMMLFRVDNIPELMVIIFFYVPSLMIVFTVYSMIKGD